MFWRGNVTGVDFNFKRRPIHTPVQSSALALPFPDRAWPIVVSCDMLEHIEPAKRRVAVQEMSRVCCQRLLLAFPSGSAAETCYSKMAAGKSSVPEWLAEHRRYGLPDAAQVRQWLQDEGWTVISTWQEAVISHQFLVSLELTPAFQALTYAAMRVLGPWCAEHFPVPSKPPLLRVFMRAERID